MHGCGDTLNVMSFGMSYCNSADFHVYVDAKYVDATTKKKTDAEMLVSSIADVLER